MQLALPDNTAGAKLILDSPQDMTDDANSLANSIDGSVKQDVISRFAAK